MNSTEQPAVVAEGLTRRYERKGREDCVALEALSLTVPSREVHGLLGPNGAGKTTFCKILATVLTPSSGSARVLGHDVVHSTQSVRRSIGIVFGGERGLYPRLSARQNLHYWSALYHQPSALGRRRASELLERFGLDGRADDRVETFSRGMKQRLHLARGLVGDPRVLILDEPTVGMDPVSAREFRVLISELRDEGRTVLLTTHDMAEAEAVCDRVSLIDSGRLVTTEDPRTIGQWISQYERVVAENVPEVIAHALEDLEGVTTVERSGLRLTVETNVDGAARNVLRVLVEAGVTSISTGHPSLEDVYLHLIGKRGLGLGARTNALTDRGRADGVHG